MGFQPTHKIGDEFVQLKGTDLKSEYIDKDGNVFARNKRAATELSADDLVAWAESQLDAPEPEPEPEPELDPEPEEPVFVPKWLPGKHTFPDDIAALILSAKHRGGGVVQDINGRMVTWNGNHYVDLAENTPLGCQRARILIPEGIEFEVIEKVIEE